MSLEGEPLEEDLVVVVFAFVPVVTERVIIVTEMETMDRTIGVITKVTKSAVSSVNACVERGRPSKVDNREEKIVARSSIAGPGALADITSFRAPENARRTRLALGRVISRRSEVAFCLEGFEESSRVKELREPRTSNEPRIGG